MTKRIAAGLAAAIILAGCGSLIPVSTPLLTGSGPCYLLTQDVLLVADARYGTAIGGIEVPMPVAWPPGFTGRRVGSEVEVLDPQGSVRAVTGSKVELSGGYAGEGNGVSLSLPAPGAVFLQCGAGYSEGSSDVS